jgi:hypothetical protein
VPAGRFLVAILVVPLVALAACADKPEPPTTATTAACGPAPTSSVRGVRETLLPTGAVLTSLQPAQDRTTLEAYVPRTPVALRAEYEARDDLRVLEAEDEGHEAELLVSDGSRRAVVKINAECGGASTMRLVIAPEVTTTTS